MNHNKGYFAGGLFIGTVIGGALGLLFAPGPGKEIRQKVKDSAEEAFGEVYAQAIEYTENLKEQFQDMTDSVTDKVNQYKEDIESKIQEIQDEIDDDLEEIEAYAALAEEEDLAATEDEAMAETEKTEENPSENA